jgi:hypothetical protein
MRLQDADGDTASKAMVQTYWMMTSSSRNRRRSVCPKNADDDPDEVDRWYAAENGDAGPH